MACRKGYLQEVERRSKQGIWQEHGGGVYSVRILPLASNERSSETDDWGTPEQQEKLKQLREQIRSLTENSPESGPEGASPTH